MLKYLKTCCWDDVFRQRIPDVSSSAIGKDRFCKEQFIIYFEKISQQKKQKILYDVDVINSLDFDLIAKL